jgi:Family of unknown function (DUF5317)
MLMGLIAVLALAAAAVLRPGSLPRFARLPVRAVWLLPLALGLQVLVVNVIPSLPHALGAFVHVASYGLLAGFLALNIRLPGMPLVVTGTAANAVTIAINGGVLPASASALHAAGWSAGTEEFANSAVVASPRLAFLGDVFVTPPWIPFANVYSIGDVLIALGIVVHVLGATRRRARHHADSPGILRRLARGPAAKITRRHGPRLPPSGDGSERETPKPAASPRGPDRLIRRPVAVELAQSPGLGHETGVSGGQHRAADAVWTCSFT